MIKVQAAVQFTKLAVKKVLGARGYTISRSASLGDFLRSRNVTLALGIGANVGQYRDLLRSEGYRGEIISFEPIKSRLNIASLACGCIGQRLPPGHLQTVNGLPACGRESEAYL